MKALIAGGFADSRMLERLEAADDGALGGIRTRRNRRAVHRLHRCRVPTSDDPHDLLDRVDATMYAAKRAGGNQIELAP